MGLERNDNMNNLTTINYNGINVIESTQVSEMTGKIINIL
ncbi:hypothetical protein CNEO4_220027 [Clostridium neonatale]|nr:hypothetical protein CNEO4_220027 [Clostridium neonatale]